MSNNHVKNLSHGTSLKSFQQSVEVLQLSIQKMGNNNQSTVQERLKILHELTLFPLGRFLIENRGMNGYWTHYVCTTNEIEESEALKKSELEMFMLTKRPLALATQERFRIFQKIAQSKLNEGIRFASIPSGLMGEFLFLDYSGLKKCELFAFDIDEESLILSKKLATEKKLLPFATFRQQDAWQSFGKESFDLISSSGLNIYVKEDDRILSLYKNFFEAIKPGGHLLTSTMAPPPWKSSESSWKMSGINSDDLIRQRTIYEEVLGFKGSCYRTIEETVKQLVLVGFSDIQIFEDKAGIFPTILAKKKTAKGVSNAR